MFVRVWQDMTEEPAPVHMKFVKQHNSTYTVEAAVH